MKRSSTQFFRRFCYFVLLLVAVAVTALAIFISQLELDDYRQELEQELSAILDLPVKIGRSSLTYQHGIALKLNALRIGSPDKPLAEIPQLTAILKIKPLFDGQVVLDRVLVDRPKLQLWLPTRQRPEQGSTYDLMDWFGIRILTIQDAELVIHQQVDKQSRQLLKLNQLQLLLTGWETGKTGQLLLKGQYPQPQQPADFNLELNLPSSTDPDRWRNENFHARLSLENFSTRMLPKPPGENFPDSFSLFATLDGTPATGADLQAKLRSDDDQKEVLKISGVWRSSAEQQLLSQLTGLLQGLPIKGELKLQRQEHGHLLASRIEAEPTTLTPELLARWPIPETLKLQSGQLARLALALEQQWDADLKPSGPPQISAKLNLTALQWGSPEQRPLQAFNIELTLTEKLLLIKDAQAVIGDHPIRVSGRISEPFTQPRLDLKLSAVPQLTPFKQQLGLPTDWQLAGAAPLTLQLRGAASHPNFRLNFDLTSVDLTLGRLLQKPVGQTASLQAEGVLNSVQLQVNQASLQLGDLTLSGAGVFPLKNIGQTFQFELDEFELAQLQQQSLLLKKLRLVGKAHLFLDRQQGALQGSLKLAAVGAHLFNMVSDLQRTSGEIKFNQQGLSFANLRASLGQSPLRVSGKLDSWQKPQLKLDIKGRKVRAQDLIFRNQQLTLYDLDGQLRITTKDLFFESVKVRLEDATLATVRGKVADFSDPQTILDIESEQADILAVIKLFIGPAIRAHAPRHKEYKPLLINVTAAHGTLGGLRFDEAQGTITDHRGILSIYPLSFKSGPGYCYARVEIDRTQKRGLLKVSGHAEDLDASVLHEDVFLKRGLVSGRLRGDFYLEGEPGNNFWPTARGGIHLQLKDGTLRKFRGLAQVFSILNVSQLFSLKLPDMAKEGMPFDLLEGSILVADGLMTTKDLYIYSKAMNMSLAGTNNLREESVDFELAVMPLGTVDKVITNIPIAGWVLTGDEKALITAQFKIKGPSAAPEVTAVPITAVSDTFFGIIKRTVGLPFKLIKDIDTLLQQKPEKNKKIEEQK